MKKTFVLSIAVCIFAATTASADTFGTGDNQFEIEFVPISGDASSANGTNISQYSRGEGSYKAFSDPGDYRMGVYEITQGWWVKFENSYGLVYGNPKGAYREDAAYGTTRYEPTNNVSWYEAAQFVNWLNTSKGYQAAYKFTGIQGTINYTFSVWDATDVGYNPDNPFRNSRAHYFLPTEDEWVKAAYWNGNNLQTYATIGDYQPNTAESNWGRAVGIKKVGRGIQELNGTYDMMGNMWELMESPYYPGDYVSGAKPCMRGGSTQGDPDHISSSLRVWTYPNTTALNKGFRVASVPEAATVSIDIKPQSCPNPLNVKSDGVLPVAILGVEDFDVNEIDPISLEILGVSPLRSSLEDVAAPVAEEALPEDCLCSTEGPDGFMDLTLKFDSQEIIEAIGEVEDGEMIILTLTGSLQDGTPIEGTDCVLIRKKGKQ